MNNNINYNADSEFNIISNKQVNDLSERNLLTSTYQNSSNIQANSLTTYHSYPEGITINQIPVIHNQYQPTDIPTNVIHVVRALPPMERVFTENYSKVACSSITTMWLGNYGYSYLSNYANDSNYFFIPRDKDGFTLNNWTEANTLYKLQKEKMTQFINEFNKVSNVASIVKNFYSKTDRPKRKNSFLFLIFLIIFLISLVCLVNVTNNKRHRIFYQVALPLVCAVSWLICIIFLVLMIAGCVKSKVSIAAELDKNIINQTPQIESFVDQWNNKEFLPLGLYIIVPRNLSYIQFSLNSNAKFSLEDHSFPNDLKPKRMYSLSKQYV
jgi:hypothetical protein